ncbi:MAG: phosphatase PAP2 family protein [Candidatus Pacearchaeota archaeon]|jgi:undecaprenyl-diphosphatase
MKKRVIIIGIFIVLFIFLSLYFDSEIIKIISEIKNNFFDEFFMGITFISSSIIIFFFLTSLFLWKEHKRKWILPLWFTLILSAIFSFLLKFSIKRARPFQEGLVSIIPILEKSSHLIWNFSFPSFHSMLVFCAVPILSKEFPKFKYVWISFASLIAFSRIYFGLHFLSDIIAGAFIGYLLGIAIIKMEKETNFFKKIYEKIFEKK